jgi:hypothetical protein
MRPNETVPDSGYTVNFLGVGLSRPLTVLHGATA